MPGSTEPDFEEGSFHRRGLKAAPKVALMNHRLLEFAPITMFKMEAITTVTKPIEIAS